MGGGLGVGVLLVAVVQVSSYTSRGEALKPSLSCYIDE